jgi:hypothetical protein
MGTKSARRSAPRAPVAGLPVGVVAGADASITSILFLGRYASGYQSMRVHGKNKK